MCAYVCFFGTWLFFWSLFLNDILYLDTFHPLVFYFCTSSVVARRVSTFYGESWTSKIKVILYYFSRLLHFIYLFYILQLGVLLDRRLLTLVLPVFSFVVLYSKLPHKVLQRKYIHHWLASYLRKSTYIQSY